MVTDEDLQPIETTKLPFYHELAARPEIESEVTDLFEPEKVNFELNQFQVEAEKAQDEEEKNWQTLDEIYEEFADFENFGLNVEGAIEEVLKLTIPFSTSPNFIKYDPGQQLLIGPELKQVIVWALTRDGHISDLVSDQQITEEHQVSLNLVQAIILTFPNRQEQYLKINPTGSQQTIILFDPEFARIISEALENNYQSDGLC